MTNKFECFSNIHQENNRGSGHQFKEFLDDRQREMLDQGDRKRALISSVSELESYNREMREHFLESLGGLPEASCSLDAKVTKTFDMGEFMLEQIVFRSRPGVYVTGSMYLPKGLNAPSAAVLFLCGHWEDSRMSENYQMVCQILVRAGLIVFAIDAPGQGEKSNYYDAKTKEYLIERAVPDHDACGVPAVATGRFLESYFLSDQIRAVDYMLTRPEIDPKRIGMTGNSGGGLQTISTMICEERIAAAAPGTFVTTRREILHTAQSQDSEQIWPGAAAYGFDHVNTLLLFAPRPIALLAVNWDFFPIEGTEEAFEEARRLFGLYGKMGNIRMYTDDYSHRYTEKLAVNAAEFFTELFFGEKRTVDSGNIQYFSADIMNATKSGNIIGEIEDAKSVLDEVRELAVVQRECRLSLPEQERLAVARRWLLERVQYERRPVKFNPRMHNATSKITVGEEEYVGVDISWWTQKNLFSYGVLVKKACYEWNNQLPTVIAIWNDGTKDIAKHEEWIRHQCDEGKQVLVLDVPGVGNLRQNRIWGEKDYKEGYGALYHLCGDLMYMGDSMAAMHCYDVLRAVEMVCTQFGVQEEHITLYCAGDDGVYGVMAGFLNEKVGMEYADNLLHSIEREIIGQKVLQYDNTLSLIVPGMLQYFDYEELMR